MMHRYFLWMLLFFSIPLGGTADIDTIMWEKSPYLDTTCLTNFPRMQQRLLADGFEKVHFLTPDKLRLCGLFRRVPNAHATIVFCNGWCPGRKESLSTLFHLLRDQNINMLFFDARNHGESDGSLFHTLGHPVIPTNWRPALTNWFMYGNSEYKDIIGAARFVNKQSAHTPIIIYGTCAGAFNAAHALIALNKQAERLNIKGFIFDSGWSSLYATSKMTLIDTFNQGLQKFWSLVYQSKKAVKESLIYKASSTLAGSAVTVIHGFLVGLPFALRELNTTLQNKISAISIPIFFIHSHDDAAVPIADALSLAQKCKNTVCWWIPNSTHACHYLKHKHQYRRRLIDFVNRVVSPLDKITV